MSDTPWYARELIRRGLRKLGVKPASPTPVPFAEGIDKSIFVTCPCCDVKAMMPLPPRGRQETTPEYMLRCMQFATQAHATRRPTCPGEGLQISMSI